MERPLAIVHIFEYCRWADNGKQVANWLCCSDFSVFFLFGNSKRKFNDKQKCLLKIDEDGDRYSAVRCCSWTKLWYTVLHYNLCKRNSLFMFFDLLLMINSYILIWKLACTYISFWCRLVTHTHAQAATQKTSSDYKSKLATFRDFVSFFFVFLRIENRLKKFLCRHWQVFFFFKKKNDVDAWYLSLAAIFIFSLEFIRFIFFLSILMCTWFVYVSCSSSRL